MVVLFQKIVIFAGFMSERTFLKTALIGAAAGLAGLFAFAAIPAAAQTTAPAPAPAQVTPAPAPPVTPGTQDPAPVFVHPTLASQSKAGVGLRLVCLFDTGGSIDQTEYKVQ